MERDPLTCNRTFPPAFDNPLVFCVLRQRLSFVSIWGNCRRIGSWHKSSTKRARIRISILFFQIACSREAVFRPIDNFDFLQGRDNRLRFFDVAKYRSLFLPTNRTTRSRQQKKFFTVQIRATHQLVATVGVLFRFNQIPIKATWTEPRVVIIRDNVSPMIWRPFAAPIATPARVHFIGSFNWFQRFASSSCDRSPDRKCS